jgi:acyl-CoA dehydrogenase
MGDTRLDALTHAARLVGERNERKLENLGEDEAAKAAMAALAKADLVRWAVASDHGGAPPEGLAPSGSEVSVRALCALREELAYHSGMLDVVLIMQALGSLPIAAGGSDELKKAILPEVARGHEVAAFAVTEEGAGSSLGEVATRAERQGDTWRLNGSKTFITNAGVATFYSVLARTSGETSDGGRDSLTMFYVPASTRGLEIRRFEVMAPHPIGEVILNDVELPDRYRLGEPGEGLGLALGTLARCRNSVAAAAVGFARRALDESRAHLKRRQQFGRPLSTFQGLRFDLAEMDTRLRAAQLLVAEAAAELDAGRPATREVARAKLYATETASWICDRAVQHLGGLGVKRGSVVERLYRETRALRIYEGTSEVQKLILAKELLSAD